MNELIRKLQNTDQCYCGSQVVDGELKLVACLFHQAAKEIEELLAANERLGEMVCEQGAEADRLRGVKDDPSNSRGS